jgi:Lrp/AsnC family leucine-responsive transcriptional regulator
VERALDRIDVQLLNLVQQNNLRTAESLAEEVPLSPSAITRRLRRLRSSGLIQCDIALLTSDIFERLRVVIRIQLEKTADVEGVAELRERLANETPVQACFEISGAFDLLLIVNVRNMADFNAFADSRIGREPLIRRYESEFIRREIKNTPIYDLQEGDCSR